MSPLARIAFAACMLSMAGLALAITACSEEPEEAAAPGPPLRPAIYQLAHLGIADRTPPELWLASRQAHRDLPEDDVGVTELKHALDVAARRFREHPRMIANRAVQLEGMLGEKHLGEAAPELIERLSRVPGETRYVESFGGLCQQYYNLRMQGLEPEAAVRALREGGDASN